MGVALGLAVGVCVKVGVDVAVGVDVVGVAVHDFGEQLEGLFGLAGLGQPHTVGDNRLDQVGMGA
ncbi:MAG: hypothetical protein ACP5JJ_05350, partial [Anaerolineae bacterium]